MKRTLHPIGILSILLLFILSGCNAIFMPAKQNIVIKTQNRDAKIFVDNEEVEQSEKTKVRKAGTKQVVIQTEGYKDAYYVLIPQRRAAAFYPLSVLNIGVLIYYGYMMDALVKEKTFIYPKVNTFKPENKLKYRQANEKYIAIDAIGLDIKDKKKNTNDYFVTHGPDLAAEFKKAEKTRAAEQKKMDLKESKKKKKSKNKLVDEDKDIKHEDTKFSENIYKTLKTTGYIDTVNKVFLDNNNTLVLEGVIKQASVFHVATKASSSYKRAKLNMTWYIKNTFDEKMDSIDIVSYSGDFVDHYTYGSTDNSEKMFADAVDFSYYTLSSNPKFMNYIKLDSNFSITDSKLPITSPKKVVTDVETATAASVIIKRKDKGHGSGFAISEDGYILTNFHVIAGEFTNKQAEVTVILANGDEVPAKVVRYNRMRDVALLKVDAKFDNAFPLSNEKTYKRSMEVYTIGTPKSIELGQSVAIGLISNERKTNNNNLLQLSMSVNAGNSGGPLFDKKGTLQGIVTAKLVGFATEGVAFAVPGYMLADYLNLTIK